jgi:Ca-activated chloride channel family protein
MKNNFLNQIIMSIRNQSAQAEPTSGFSKKLSREIDAKLADAEAHATAHANEDENAHENVHASAHKNPNPIPSEESGFFTKFSKFINFSSYPGLKLGGIFLITALFLGVGIFSIYFTNKPSSLTDDWKFSQNSNTDSGGIMNLLSSMGNTSKQMPQSSSLLPESMIGLSVGGAKDINNFRENINNKFLPMTTDITYEGLFYDYYFDLSGNQNKTSCTQLFCPQYTTAISNDPFTQKPEYYLSVGLNSNIKESDFQRKKLNLVVVLDISGSMDSSMVDYYYDKPQGNNVEKDNRSKITVAKEAIAGLIDHLKPEDRLGIVLFDETAYLAKPLDQLSRTDINVLKNHIKEIQSQGSTNMEAGLDLATGQFSEFLTVDSNEYENRIIFLTDAMPNTGDYSKNSFLQITTENSLNKIYSTFIGIGVDFNSSLVESITKVQGANYYSVHDNKEFYTRMVDEFDYMVTPLVFNLKMNFDSAKYKISAVYGSPEADEATGELMKVNTLFPSKTEGGAVKGGIILVKLEKIGTGTSTGTSTGTGSGTGGDGTAVGTSIIGEDDFGLTVSYQDRSGKTFTSRATEGFNVETDSTTNAANAANTADRKAILLARYVNVVKQWLNDTYQTQVVTKCSKCMYNYYQEGIPGNVIFEPGFSEWERPSQRLVVSEQYKQLFTKLLTYFQAESSTLQDDTLSKEVEIINKLLVAPVI